MYTSSTPYNYGNLGFYYDPMQFPVSHDTQTSPYLCAPVQDTSVPVYSAHLPTSNAHVPYGDSTSLHQNSESTHTVNCTTIPHGDDLSTNDYHVFSQDMLPEDGYSPPLPHNQHNQEVDPDLHYHGRQQVHQDVGCQVSSSHITPVTVIKEAKKLTLPYFDPTEMTWTSFALKLHASLIECDLAYLLRENSTNHHNSHHSKELMLELFRKLQGTVLNMFTSLTAQNYYLEGGRGIEMLKALVDKFHPLDHNAIQNIISSMQNLTLLDTEDLSTYKDKLEITTYNCLGSVKQ
jgi:hypothetical protein